MTDRDRLAADLHAPCEERWAERERQMPGFDQTLHMIDAHYAEADRLIALGWTRLDEDIGPEVTVDWTNDVIAGLERQLRDCRNRPLDEERLARALDVGVPFFEHPPQPWSVYLPAIAKAYREDTDA